MPLLEQVLEIYPKDVRIVELNFPLKKHKFARPAAVAALAAGKQGKFWELQGLLFENFRKLNDQLIVKLARDVGLDMPQFERDRKSQGITNLINRDLAQAPRHGVRGTPAVFVNGKRLRNRNLAELSRVIDRELDRKEPTLLSKPAGPGGSSPRISPPDRAVNAECG